MRKLMIALILVTASSGALAQASSIGNDAGTTTASDDDAVSTPKRTTPATTPEVRRGATRSDSARSNNPRWHSFLPGMFR